MKRLAIPAALVVLALSTGVVSAHTASSTCEHITIAKSALNATVYDHDTAIVALGPVKAGTYRIAAGDYDVVWTDGFTVPGLLVESCPTASPSPTPNATPHATPTPRSTGPIPTPPATDTGSRAQYQSDVTGAVVIIGLGWAVLACLYLLFFRGASRHDRD